MPGISNLTAQIRALDAQLASAWGNLEQMRSVFTDLSRLSLQATDPNDIRLLDQRLRLVKENLKVMQDTTSASEKQRTELERLVTTNKTWLTVLDKLDPALKKIGGSVIGISKGIAALKTGNLGELVTAVGQTTGVFKGLTAAVGMAINAYVKFQDRVQLTNKTVIDASAAVGKFAQGMRLAAFHGHELRTSIVGYSQFVGISADETNKAVESLADLGFSMQEMGFDEQTHQIKSVTDSIQQQSESWGALAASIAVARTAGLDQGRVMAAMQLQVKGLGDSVKDVATTFAELSTAASRSALSTSILLPILRGAQESFKYLGIDSTEAARALGEAGKAAKAAGLGSQAASELMGKAMDAMAAMDFGTMTFLGQQLGMGGGLTAGFQFRQQAAQAPGGMAQDIGRLSGQLMGGTGDIISEEQARSNEYLASIRLGQEMLVGQFMGMNARESRAYLNLVEQMNTLKAQGKSTKEVENSLKMMEGGEAAYRARTLTMQQKIAQLLEVITAVVGRMLITFVRAFAGGAGKGTEGLAGVLSKAFKGIEAGRGFDEIFAGGEQGFQKELDKSFGGIEKSLSTWGQRLGSVFSFFFDGFYKSIASIIALYMGSKVTSRLVELGIGNLLGLGVRSAAGAAVGAAAGAVPGIAGAAAQATTQIAKNAGVVGRLFSGLGGVGGSVLRLFTGLAPLVTSLLPALAALGVGIGVFTAASWALEKSGAAKRLEEVSYKLTTAFLGVDKAVREHNQEMLRATKIQKERAAESGFKTGVEAQAALQQQGGLLGMAAMGGTEKAKAALDQALSKSGQLVRMYQDSVSKNQRIVSQYSTIVGYWTTSQEQMTQAAGEVSRSRSALAGELARVETYRKQMDALSHIEQMKPEEQAQLMSGILAGTQLATTPEEIRMNQNATSNIIQKVEAKGILPQTEQRVNVDINVKGDEVIRHAIDTRVERHIESGNVAPGQTSKSGSNVGRTTGYRS